MSFLGIEFSEPRTVLSTNKIKKVISFLGNMHIEFINMITIFREAKILMETRKKI